MIITKKHLPRRTFLRGLGVSLALPMLDSMVPAFASATSAQATRRLGVVYVPNGMFMQNWTPAMLGASSGPLEITETLRPLAAHRDRLLMVSGLCSEEGIARPGEGAGDHARAAGAFLTGVHPKKTEGHDIRAGVSMDQLAARVLGRETQLASLELSLESAERAGSCDPGYSCAYANTLCWSSDTTPLPMASDPRAVFERLFGAGGTTDPAAWLEARQHDRSLLDMVTAKVARLKGELGHRDRIKLNEYLDAVRDVERRIQMAEQQPTRELPAMDQPAGVPGRFEDHAKLMFDLQVLAYQADLTRVITFMLGHETSNRAYPEIGVPDAHHALSHHGGDRELIERLKKVDVHLASMFAYYVGRLASTPDGDGTLLDSVMILYGSGLSDGNRHNHHDLPTLLVGGGAGQLRGGRHLQVAKDTPNANLFLTMLGKLGVPVEAFGDSTGRVQALSV
ncbi:MAG: DUF1552 domain-containing protein [Acidobacteriota bacterium]|nr:DUF1552 domain-containing protein [Acidobacteriota bacterium]